MAENRSGMGAGSTSSVEPDPLRGTAYRALRRIGSGSMGDVFAAEHGYLEKVVCVKLLKREHASDPRTVDRVRLEAQVLLALDGHPHVLPARDVGRTPDGQMFLVTELLEGRTLADELAARGALPLDEALQYAIDLGAGLAAAHRLGVVHRDVKPANLFVTEATGSTGKSRRRLVVMDFGLAKASPAAAEGGSSKVRPLRDPTTEGRILGTPRYISPEQALGKPVDARTDVYAAGLVVYALLAGRGPFDDVRGMLALLEAHIGAAPEPPSRHNPGLPRAIDAVVLRAIAKSPADRFESIDAFVAALRRAAQVAAPPTDQVAEARPAQRFSADAPTAAIDLEPRPPPQHEPTTRLLPPSPAALAATAPGQAARGGLAVFAAAGAALALTLMLVAWLLGGAR
jgi:serine/threonine-protein kinase